MVNRPAAVLNMCLWAANETAIVQLITRVLRTITITIEVNAKLNTIITEIKWLVI